MPHSGLQREVFSLYRQLLRAAQRKQPQLLQHIRGTQHERTQHTRRLLHFPLPSPASVHSFTVRAGCACNVLDEFRRESGGSRSDVNHIEWLLRRGHKQLTLFSQRNVKQITFQRPTNAEPSD